MTLRKFIFFLLDLLMTDRTDAPAESPASSSSNLLILSSSLSAGACLWRDSECGCCRCCGFVFECGGFTCAYRSRRCTSCGVQAGLGHGCVYWDNFATACGALSGHQNLRAKVGRASISCCYGRWCLQRSACELFFREAETTLRVYFRVRKSTGG